MKLSGFFAELNFSVNGATRAIDDHLEKELFRCWDAWLTEFLKIVPVWTGESVGSVLPLARVIGRSIPIVPASTAPGNLSGRGASRSEAELTGGKGKWYIQYRTTVAHLIINEYFNARIWGFNLRRPGPYHFQEKAAAAFNAEADSVRLPDLSRFFDYDTRSF
jgi:hypothetical protein